jgi:hypothetical protein
MNLKSHFQVHNLVQIRWKFMHEDVLQSWSWYVKVI